MPVHLHANHCFTTGMTLTQAAVHVSCCYDAVHRFTAERPTVNLDAATLLAAFILRIYMGRKEFAPYGVTPAKRAPADIAFSGDDLICIVFTFGPMRHVLTATTDGIVEYMGSQPAH
jgi:hypothetical protein